MTKYLQSKGFDPGIFSVEDQCANHNTMEPSVIAIIFKWFLVYTSLLLQNLLNSVNSLTVPVKVEKNSNAIYKMVISMDKYGLYGSTPS